MTTAKERLEQILSEKDLSVQKFVDALGVNRGAVSSVKNNQTKSISLELSDKIVSVYPEYSELWLLTGKEPKYASQLCGDINLDIDQSTGKRENSGSGDYFEGADASAIRIQMENEFLKAENERLRSDIEQLKADKELVDAERKELLAKLLNK